MHHRALPRLLAAALLTVAALFLVSSAPAEEGQVIKITAKRFEYNPNTITLKRGVPVTLEFTSLDRVHGFICPGLGIRTDIEPGKVNTLQFTPQKTGTFDFHCDVFCGLGHSNMTGKFIVTE